MTGWEPADLALAVALPLARMWIFMALTLRLLSFADEEWETSNKYSFQVPNLRIFK